VTVDGGFKVDLVAAVDGLEAETLVLSVFVTPIAVDGLLMPKDGLVIPPLADTDPLFLSAAVVFSVDVAGDGLLSLLVAGLATPSLLGVVVLASALMPMELAGLADTLPGDGLTFKLSANMPCRVLTSSLTFSICSATYCLT